MSDQNHACIFHPRIKALKVYQILDTVMKQWFHYGLCPICNHRLVKEESFKKLINEKLEELSYKLKKQEENKNV